MGSARFVLAAVAATCISMATGASAQDGAAGAGTEEVDQCLRDPGVDGVVAEDRAYEHYDRGLNLYEQGDYEAAVEEFVLAYCHKPSPSVLKDIGQSFERLVDYEKAVVYLERYIAEAPDSEAEARRVQSARVQVLRNLPARVRIATEPPGATVTLTGLAGVSARGLSSAGGPLQVRHGTYALTVELAGHDPVHESIEVKIGQPYSYYFRLQRKKGTVRVVAVPSDARIFVNQRWVAIGNYVDQLPIDTYTVSAEADGWTAREVQIEVTEGNQRDVVLELERVPRSGRTELVAAAAIGGGVWGSGTLVKILGDTTVTGSLGAALGIGLGLGSAYLGVPDDLPQGHSSYIMGTTLIGATEGLLVSSLIMRQRDGDVDVDVASGVALATGAVALLGSALTASRVDLDAGDAALINSGALWGTLSGVLFWTVFDQDTRILEPLLLGGLNIGLVTGILLARSNEVSRSHVALIDLSGLVGLVVLTPFATITSEDGGINERTPHFALLGMGLGLITGTYFTRHMDEPSSFGSVRPSLGTASDAGGRSIMSIGLESRF